MGPNVVKEPLLQGKTSTPSVYPAPESIKNGKSA